MNDSGEPADCPRSETDPDCRRQPRAPCRAGHLLCDLNLRLCAVFFLAMALMPAEGLGFELCWWRSIFHVPCPGCGLTRSGSNLVRGHFARAFEYHPFGPILFCVIFPATLAAVLPRSWRARGRLAMRPWVPPLWTALRLLFYLFLAFGFARVLGVLLGWMEFPPPMP